MLTITANSLKTNGVSTLRENEEVIITVRGQNKYVALSIEKYNYLRQCELEAALIETKKEIELGKFTMESVDKHIKRISRKTKKKK